MLSYFGLELFYEFIPQLLPRKFTRLVDTVRVILRVLENLQEALKDEPWVFGYSSVSSSGKIQEAVVPEMETWTKNIKLGMLY